jgi:hypothetical protein
MERQYHRTDKKESPGTFPLPGRYRSIPRQCTGFGYFAAPVF